MAQPESITLDTPQFDQARAEAAVRELLLAVGEDPTRHGLQDTPARVARAFREMFAGLYTDPDSVLETTFDEQHDELVLVKNIPMYSTCEHHLVSFHGVAHVGYIPGDDGRVTGLSKLARFDRPTLIRITKPYTPQFGVAVNEGTVAEFAPEVAARIVNLGFGEVVTK